MLRYTLTVLLLLAASPALAQQEMRSATKGSSTPLPITGTVIDANHNGLDVNIVGGSGGGSGGTQYTEDGASAGGESLTLSGAVRRDTAASSSTTDGDYSTLNTDSTGRLWTNTELPDAAAASDSYSNPTAPSVLAHIMCYDGSTWLRQPRVSDTDAVGVSGNNCRTAAMGWNFNGTSWDRNRGAVNALNSVGTGIQAAQIVGQFDDTSPTAITENQFGNLRMSANRNLYGTIRDAAGNERGLNVDANGEIGIGAIRSALPAGTNAIGKLSANSGVDIGDVDITSIIPGTGATNLGKAEDTAHTSGDTGTLMLGVRNDSAVTGLSDANGDYTPIATDSNGRLFINTISAISSSMTPGTAAANLGKAEDAVHTTGDTGVAIWAKRTDTPASSGANGDYVTINSDASGYLYTIPRSSGSTGAAPPDRASYSAGLGSGATGGFLTGIPVSDTFKSVSVTSATTTLLITGVSGRHIRIGSINLVSAIANNVALISGTGATCGTGTTGVAGGTTAANGWNLAANAGLAYGNGLGTIMQTTATGDSICVVTSAIGPLAGTIGYAIY